MVPDHDLCIPEIEESRKVTDTHIFFMEGVEDQACGCARSGCEDSRFGNKNGDYFMRKDLSLPTQLKIQLMITVLKRGESVWNLFSGGNGEGFCRDNYGSPLILERHIQDGSRSANGRNLDEKARALSRQKDRKGTVVRPDENSWVDAQPHVIEMAFSPYIPPPITEADLDPFGFFRRCLDLERKRRPFYRTRYRDGLVDPEGFPPFPKPS
jgi:hypothetical protein